MYRRTEIEGELEMERWHPHGPRISPEDLERVHLHFMGEVAGFKVWMVDGPAVRNLVDIDFTNGGNPARYAFVPANEIWLDSTAEPSDMAATLVHELVETTLMEDGGLTYDRGHDFASTLEQTLRDAIVGGAFVVKRYQDIVPKVEEWITQKVASLRLAWEVEPQESRPQQAQIGDGVQLTHSVREWHELLQDMEITDDEGQLLSTTRIRARFLRAEGTIYAIEAIGRGPEAHYFIDFDNAYLNDLMHSWRWDRQEFRLIDRPDTTSGLKRAWEVEPTLKGSLVRATTGNTWYGVVLAEFSDDSGERTYVAVWESNPGQARISYDQFVSDWRERGERTFSTWAEWAALRTEVPTPFLETTSLCSQYGNSPTKFEIIEAIPDAIRVQAALTDNKSLELNVSSPE